MEKGTFLPFPMMIRGLRTVPSNTEASYVNGSDDGGILFATHEYGCENEWILDSGCSFYMTPNKDLFTTYERLDRQNVTMGNNATCKVVGVKSVQMKMF